MAGVKSCVCLLILLKCFESISGEGSDEMWWKHEFVLSIPSLYYADNVYPPAVYITTSSTRKLRTTLAYHATGYGVSNNVSRSSPAIIKLDGDIVGISDTRIEAHDKPQNKTIIIRSEGTVSVHAIDNARSAGDGFVVYPNSQLGTEYYVTSYTPVRPYTSVLCVSSPQPNTLVTLKTKAGQTRSITLRQYESYRFDGEIGEDLSGTLVQSDKPIAVISGGVANIPSQIISADGILEQLTPTNQWKRNFILTPFTLTSGYIYRIYSLNFKTTISISDNTTRHLEPESFYEGNVEGDRVLTIIADNPVLAVQYLKSANTYDPPSGDPVMVDIPPVTSFTHGMVTFPVIEWIRGHYYFINVVTDCSNVDGLFLDNKTDIRNWDRLTTEDQETCCVRGSVTSGQHTVSQTNAAASFYILVYGISTSCCSAYAYTANTYYDKDISDTKGVTTIQQFTDISDTKGVTTIQQFTAVSGVTSITTIQQLTDAVIDAVKVIQVKQTEIMISWDSFQADETIDHFRVFYNTGDSLKLNVAHIVEINGALSMAVLSDLATSTLYTVRVEAYTKTGRVYEVGEIKVTTTSEILQVEGQKSTEVRVRWDGFQTDEDIVHFRVLYTSDDLSNFESVRTYLVGNMQHYAVISGLEPATLYIIRVEAVTKSNTIIEVGQVTVTTRTATYILQVEEQKSIEVRVRWDGFRTDENVIKFRVLYTSESLSNINSVHIDDVDNMKHYAVISGLEPATLYIIRVEAVTDNDMILVVGEVTVTTETATSGIINIPLVIGSAVGGVVMVMIIIIVIVVLCTRQHRRSKSPTVDSQHAMTIHGPGNQENTSGDINEGYEVPPGLQTEHNVDRPYMDLDGTQRMDPYE